MFAYCLNNPVNSYDPNGMCSYSVYTGGKGCYRCKNNQRYATPKLPAMPSSYADSYSAYVGEQVGSWISDVCSADVNDDTPNATIKRLAILTWNCLDVSAGVGLGMFGGVSVAYLGADLGMYYNPINFELKNGKFRYVQVFHEGINVSTPIGGWGFFDDMEITFQGQGPVTQTQGLYSNDSFTIVSAGIYFIAGGCFNIGFDTISFFRGLDEVF